ncbi:cytochrome c oxidase subunit 3 [Pseudoduganella plicata]|uniref:cytochrome-c oxidase n=1 Tax=Pseudoduganella plicata TaxID=321984 RepID=A0A4P7BJI8_9BURK|nr:cytochrome c oxidase subunit 3 [Pseudoduganella plicata]QBQ38327.1 cytochrome c oxidase subunit 3 [Pseudoduganella plicata]GGY81240.1 cytochrome c oxidase subunit III [Pseudoduganella plicata]
MSSNNATAPHYFVPGPSRWPMLAGMSMLVTMVGASGWVNDAAWGRIVCLVGIVAMIAVLFGWFGDAIRESESGLYGKRIDYSFRWSMGWFIFSEVMFFGAFFGALFYARVITMPWLGDLDNKVLWPDYAPQWGNAGPAGVVDAFNTMGPFPIPTLNTALLLASGVTLTIAHHALQAGKRSKTIAWLAATVLLGAVFMGFQAYEYIHAYSELNLKLTSGIYGSTFFMLTGFHGFHVTMGAIMLSVVLFRLMKGHFTPEHHFAFEGAAWYWHFVDVVWLGLYVIVYWL